MGLDSDDPLSDGEVGRVGVAIDTLDDMELLFDRIPLDRVSTSMTINATAAVLLGLYVAVADRRGIPRDRLSGTVQNDILKEFIARGTYIYPVEPSLRLVTDILENAGFDILESSAAITCAKPDPLQSRRSRLRSGTPGSTFDERWTVGWSSSSSLRG